jgi:hypothetical protein
MSARARPLLADAPFPIARAMGERPRLSSPDIVARTFLSP